MEIVQVEFGCPVVNVIILLHGYLNKNILHSDLQMCIEINRKVCKESADSYCVKYKLFLKKAFFMANYVYFLYLAVFYCVIGRIH